MSFWSSLLRLFVVPAERPAPAPEPTRAAKLPDTITDEWFGGLKKSKSGVPVTPSTALQVTAFWRAVNIIGGILGSITFGVYRVTDDSAIRDRKHPVDILLSRNPSPLFSRFDFYQTLALHLLTFGNFYARIVRNGAGRVAALEVMHPARVTTQMNSRKQLVYVYRQTEDEGGGEIRMLYWNVFHVSHLSWNGVNGIDQIQNFRDVLGTAIANQDFLANFYGNGATLSGVVSVPQKLDGESYKRLRQSWNDSYSGPNNAGATAILEQGAKYEKVGLSPAEAGSAEAKKMAVSDVSRITGVPQFLLEDLDRATFNNIEHLGQLFVTYTILPLCRNIEAEADWKLFSLEEQNNREVRADLSQLMRADTENRAKLIESLMKWGIINRDEARAIEGMNPISDGSGKAYFVPMNMVDPTKEEPGHAEPPAANSDTDEEQQPQS